MDNIVTLLKDMLTEREVMTYLLVESGMTYQDLAERLGVSNTGIMRTYQIASKKMEKLANAGFFQSDFNGKATS